MKRFAACLLSLVLAAFAAPTLAQNSQVVVTSASADSKLAVLVIFGRNFSRVRTLTVTLSGFTAPLRIAAFNDTQITTLLPTGIAPGSYWITAGEDKGGNQDRISVTLGAQGPQGAAGPAIADISALNGLPCFSLQGVVLGRTAVSIPPITQPGTYAITINCVASLPTQPPGPGTPPGTYDPLATTAGTVLSALTLLTAPQDWPVNGNCSGAPMINCVNGNVVTTYVHEAPVGTPAITQLTPLSFAFTLELSLATVSDIQLQPFPGAGICYASLDTSRTGSPTMHVAGTAVFDSDPTVDPPNRLTMTDVAFSGIDPADFAFTGDPTCVTQMTQAASTAVTLFEQQFSAHVNGMRLCGAPGPGLFETCP